ncbi:Diacylglycerol o, partial [Globisporangium splendens]
MTAAADKEPLVASSTESSTDAGPVQTCKAFEYVPPPYFDAHSRTPKWLQQCVVWVFNFVAIHYNLWIVPFLVLFYYLYQVRVSSSVHGYWVFIVALVALYIPSFIDGSERTGNGRPWKGLRASQLWHCCSRLLKLKIVREQELDPSKRYIFGFHPHGIIVFSRIATFGGSWEKVFPNIAARLLGASAVFYVPLAREICLWLHAVDASRSTAEKVLKSGKSILVYPGGVPEIFLTEPDSKEVHLVCARLTTGGREFLFDARLLLILSQNKIMLKSRLGFVKLAIRHGAELVPVFIFGEKWFYNVWTPSPKVVSFFRKVLKFPLIVFWGRFLWMPKRLPEGKTFGIVYGKPIPTTLNPEPSDEEVQALHAQYVGEVQRIFEQYKVKFGYDADETLVILTLWGYEWKEEADDATYWLDKGQLYFVNHDAAMRKLQEIHRITSNRVVHFHGETWTIPIADHVMGLGRSTFGAHYIRKCRETWANVSKRNDFQMALFDSHTAHISLEQGSLSVDNGSFDKVMVEHLADALRDMFKMPPVILSNPPMDSWRLLKDLTREVGSLFIVLDKIGCAFDGDSLNDTDRKDKFMRFFAGRLLGCPTVFKYFKPLPNLSSDLEWRTCPRFFSVAAHRS